MFLVRLSTLWSKIACYIVALMLSGCVQYTPVSLASIEVEGSWYLENALRDMVQIDKTSPYRLYVKTQSHKSCDGFFDGEQAALDLKGMYSRQIVEDSAEVKLMRGEDVIFVHHLILRELRDVSSNEKMLSMYVADKFSNHIQQEFAYTIYQDVKCAIYNAKLQNNKNICSDNKADDKKLAQNAEQKYGRKSQYKSQKSSMRKSHQSGNKIAQASISKNVEHKSAGISS